MDGGKLRTVIRGLRRAVSPCGAGGLTDADLLRRWVAHRDEAAFEALLWRHAGAVLAVCRRVLGDAHEAEDAAQAAFLALARKAAAIGRRQAVAAWLYTVAYRAALQARARRLRRLAHASCDLDALPGRPAEDPAWRDLRPVLDEEVSRLPAKYRAAFVLCHVEGRTNEEAARELGCPVGAVLSRLARARQRLRDRLTRRGVTLAATASVGALAGEASAAVPGFVVLDAVRAAALSAAGKSLVGVVSAEAAILAEGVVRTMLMTKVKMGAVVVLAAALLGGGGGALTYRTAAGAPGAAAQGSDPFAPTAQAAPAADEKLKLLLDRKEKEIQALKDRLAELEAVFQDKTVRLERALKEREIQEAQARAAEQAARAQALDRERLAREQLALTQALEREKLAQEKARSAGGQPGVERSGDRPTEAAPTKAQVELARDEVELLEAQLVIKQAQAKAAAISREVAQRELEQGAKTMTRLELAAVVGQAEVRAAEVKEAEVRLAQAKRRLMRLLSPPENSPDAQRQRGAVLEKRLDALAREMELLRQELHQKGPSRP